MLENSKGGEMTASLVIHGARLIDGTGAPPLDNAVIRIVDGKIAGIDQGAFNDDVQNGQQVIDAAGKTVMPGLWDAHVHYHEWMAELYVRHGVTSIVDAGNHAEWIL